jgi:hypothetical protein
MVRHERTIELTLGRNLSRARMAVIYVTTDASIGKM